jgi:diguanylate cyclase (GGDEF)-like protein
MLLLGAWLSTALDNLRLATGTEKLTVTDDLTEVYNQRFLKTALRREIQRASRFDQELSLVLINVDNFSNLTDEHGDLKASLLLKELASVLAQQVRSFDVLGRQAEDEFILILPQTGRDGAAEVAERVRAVVEQHAFTMTPAGTVTVSLGVASFPQAGVDIKHLATAAERALQKAKQQGRNRVGTLDRKAA